MLDSEYCYAAANKAKIEEAECLKELDTWLMTLGVKDEVGDINWASPKQLIALLHHNLGLAPSPIWKKGRVNIRAGEIKTDETALDYLAAHNSGRVAGLLGELIRLRRIRGAIKYLTKLPTYVCDDGLIHPVCGPASDFDTRAGTITWRLAAKNPEIQQIPTDPKKDWYRIRRAFIAPPGFQLLVADEAALEVVILGHIFIRLFGDHQLADMVSPGAPDIHSVNASLVFGKFLGWSRHGRKVSDFPLSCFQDPEYPELIQLRQDIKAVWYGLMYGKSAYGFATSLRDSDGNPIGESAAQKIVDALYAALPALPRYSAFVLDYISRNHGIPGLGGAWCDLSEYTQSKDAWQLKRAHRIAQNYPMQEGGARIIGAAMVGVMHDAVLQEQGVLLERQIHDEFDFRVPMGADLFKVKERVNYHMTSYPLASHLQVKMGVGANWDEA